MRLFLLAAALLALPAPASALCRCTCIRGEMKAMKDEDAPRGGDRADTPSATADSPSTPTSGGASDPKP